MSLFIPAAGSDYTSVSKMLTFNGSSDELVVLIPTTTDTRVEMEETFMLNLSTTDDMVTVEGGPATVTIIDQTKGMHV